MQPVKLYSEEESASVNDLRMSHEVSKEGNLITTNFNDSPRMMMH